MAEVDLGIPGLVDYKEIGSGGFATVFSAFEAEANRQVAVKVLAAMDEGGRRRFDRERRTMGQTTAHDNIVTMFRSGYTDPGNRPYLVMEHMPRGSLQDYLDNEGPLGVHQAMDILLPVVDGLGFAHSTGIVHKDVKPANILISATGSPKLSDFGIAGIRDATGTSQMAFSLLYTPPETFDATTGPGGETTDPRDERSDLYSVAATLYTLITGAPLFPADSQAALMRRILTEPPPRTGDPGLDGFLAIALAKNPDDRYPNAAHFTAALRAVQQQGRAGHVVSPTVQESVPPLDPLASVELFHRPEADGWNRSTGPTTTDPTTTDPTSTGPASTGPTSTGDLPAVANVPSVDQAAPSAPPVQAVQPEQPLQPAHAARSGQGPASAATARSEEWDLDSPPAEDRKRRTPLLAVLAAVTVLAVAGAIAYVVLTNDDTPTTAAETTASTAEAATSTSQVPTTAAPTTAAPTTAPPPPEPVVYTGHSGAVWAVAALSDGHIASGGPDNTVQIWDPANPDTTQATYDGHTDVVVTVIELSDGRIASAGWGSSVHVWDPADPETAEAIYTGHSRGVEALVELADGRVASAATDAQVRVWHPDDPGVTQAIYEGHTGPLRSVAALPDGRIASASDEGTVHVWDPADPGTALAIYSAHSRGVEALIALADGRIASASDDATVHLWDPADPETTLVIYTGHADRVMALVELSDGRIATTSTDATVQVWDPGDPKVTQVVYTGHGETILAVDELADRRIATVSDDGTAQVWDPADYKDR